MEYIKFSEFIRSTQYGYTAEETSMIEGDSKYLRITDIVPYFINKERVPFCKIDEKKKEKYLVKKDDLLIARTGATTGYNVVIDNTFNNFVFASYLIRFNYDKDALSPVFLKYVLKSQQWYGFVNNYIGGSAQPGMNAKVFGKFEIPYFNIERQERIASILIAYDNLIESNNKRIRLLEQMAESLYKEWFVRFRFPGYKDVKFENRIPKSWKIKRMSEFGKIETGKTPPKERNQNYGGDIMFIKTPDMHDNLYVISTEEFLSTEGHLTQPKKLLPENSIMVSCIGTGGVVAINDRPAHTNQQINSIILNNSEYLEWLYFVCKNLKETIEMFGATGSTMTNLSKGKFEKLKIITPTENVILEYHELTKNLFSEVRVLQHKNAMLVKQRDMLLPRLMSGKLEV